MQHQQQEFSEWLYTMQQTTTTAAAAASHAASDSSSWADTDSDSDSDSEQQLSGHFAYRAQQHKSVAHKQKMVPSFERTAPMLIPQASRHRRRSSAFYMNEFEDSAPSHTTATTASSSAFGFYDYDHESSYSSSSVADDEDDPALYQNLAYFRSQNSRKAMRSSHHQQHHQSVRSRSPSPVSTASDSDDIFDMEL